MDLISTENCSVIAGSGYSLPASRIIRISASSLVLSLLAFSGLSVDMAEADDPDTSSYSERDPFWPVGYTPPEPEKEETQEVLEIEEEWPDLPVIGSSRDMAGQYRVLIPGAGVVREGEIVSLEHNGYWFHWRITGIDERGIRYDRLRVSRERSPVPPSRENAAGQSVSSEEK